MAVPCVERVIVATDDDRIAAAAEAFGAMVAMTPASCANGTERCAAILPQLDGVEVVVNLQGDAPLTPVPFVSALLAAIGQGAEVATPVLRADETLHRRLLEDQREGRVGGTTVARAADGRALYFSKAVIPHVPAERLGDPALPVFFHVGCYAYTPAALRAYAKADATPLEQLEGLEQLRFLERGMPVATVEVDPPGWDMWELNNPEDVAPIEAALRQRGLA